MVNVDVIILIYLRHVQMTSFREVTGVALLVLLVARIVVAVLEMAALRNKKIY